MDRIFIFFKYCFNLNNCDNLFKALPKLMILYEKISCINIEENWTITIDL